jgi:hypothetical protein
MHSGKYVFSQELALVNQYEFNKCIKRYNGNRHVRELDCWNLFIQLLFGQLAGLPSLRSISVCLQAHEHQLYHLGIRKLVDSSVLSRANEKRNWQIFADFGNYLIRLVRPLYANCPIPNLDIDNEVFALDSTTISVSIKQRTACFSDE